MSEAESLYERFISTPEGRQAMAGARLELDCISLLERAFFASGKTEGEFAARLGFTVSDIDDVLYSGGNIKVGDFARYMMALGYEVRFVTEPVEDGVESIPPLKRRPSLKG